MTTICALLIILLFIITLKVFFPRTDNLESEPVNLNSWRYRVSKLMHKLRLRKEKEKMYRKMFNKDYSSEDDWSSIGISPERVSKIDVY